MKHSFLIKPYAASAQVCWNIGDSGRAPDVQAVLDGSGFPSRYLPSYSPDLSPIEPGWAKVKSYLRRVAARTLEALEQALAPALDSITAQDAAAFFRHCGYAYPN